MDNALMNPILHLQARANLYIFAENWANRIKHWRLKHRFYVEAYVETHVEAQETTCQEIVKVSKTKEIQARSMRNEVKIVL